MKRRQPRARTASRRGSLSRRDFLKAGVGLAALGLAARWGASRLWTPGAAADTGVVVLTEDLHLGPSELAGGSLSAARVQDGRLLATATTGEYVSPAVRTGFPATHVGLHWRGGPAAGRFSLRASSDGVAWSDWVPVELEDGHGRGATEETFGALVRVDRAQHLQFRAEIAESRAGEGIEAVTLTAMNSEDGPQATALAEPLATEGAAAPTSKPLNYRREAWGANEAIRFNSGGEIWPRDYVPTKKMVIHHTATGNGYSTVAQAQADVRSVYTYHTITQGWGDIGYCWLVDKFGNSYEGRRGRDGPGYDGPGGRELVSEDVVGGHARSYNHGSSGIAMLGTYDVGAPGAAALNKLRDILAWECSRHGIPPSGASYFLRADDTWHANLRNICGHRDTFATACPGSAMYALIPGLRTDTVNRLANSAAPSVAITSAPAQGTRTNRNVSYAWTGGGGTGAKTYSYYLEGWELDSDVLVVEHSGFDSRLQPAWSSWTSATKASFTLYKPGHYTFHVRSRDAAGRVSVYQDNRTLLANVTPTNPPPNLPPGSPRGNTPGVAKD